MLHWPPEAPASAVVQLVAPGRDDLVGLCLRREVALGEHHVFEGGEECLRGVIEARSQASHRLQYPKIRA